MGNEPLVVVYSTFGAMRAEIIKGRLVSAGIPAMLKSESQSVMPMTVDGMGRVEILVEKIHEQEARELLAETSEGPA